MLGRKCRRKLVLVSFLDISEVESGHQIVWTCIYTIVPGSVLPIFKSDFVVVDEIRL